MVRTRKGEARGGSHAATLLREWIEALRAAQRLPLRGPARRRRSIARFRAARLPAA